MTAFTSSLDYAPSAPTIVTRIIAAINAAVARAQTRYQCEQMLEIDEHILKDAGISKYDIRAELMALNGR